MVNLINLKITEILLRISISVVLLEELLWELFCAEEPL